MGQRRRRKRGQNPSGSGSHRSFGIWTLGELLGQGGNGDVFTATRPGDKKTYAFKVLRWPFDERDVHRFENETRAYVECSDIAGVLPLVDQHFPAALRRNEPPWVVLGRAERFETALGPTPPLFRVVEAIAEIAETVALIHERDISHRDLKPGNMFRYCGRWSVGDFGLAKLGNEAGVTEPGELLGPRFYIAPEMLNDAARADGKAADVWSIAKTLWKCGTGQTFALEGELRLAERALRLSTYVRDPRAVLLDPLLEMCTRFEPIRRPSMAEFAQELRAWCHPPLRNTGDTTELDLSDLGDKLRVLRQPYLTRNQEGAERQSFMDANSRRIRDSIVPWARQLEKTLSGLGFATTLDHAVSWGLYLHAYAEPIDIEAQLVVQSDFEGCTVVIARYVRSRSETDKPLWSARCKFIAGTSGEETELSALLMDMRQQLRPALEGLISAGCP